MAQKWRIGTSGWNYKHWKGLFYPPDLSQRKWLEFYTGEFDTVELNASFYRLPKVTTFHSWYERTPQGFLWAVKANKFITHTRRLKDCEESLERFYDSIQGLKEKLGPILLQLPPSLAFDEVLFREFCTLLQDRHRHVLEVRHASWITDKVFDIMNQFNVAFCISDTAGRYPYHEAVTTDFIYIRLHGSRKLYTSEYTTQELHTWAEKILQWGKETFCYFDNDFEGYAVQNARELKKILAKLSGISARKGTE